MKIKNIASAICLFFLFLNPAFAQTTTAAILPEGKTQFLDNNGNPLSNGKVYFYLPNTTTFKTTWQDAAKTIANTNPVVLDAGGRAIIYGDGVYRQIVRTSANLTIYDVVTASVGTGGSVTSLGDGSAVGTIKTWAAFVPPANYVFSYGQELSRTTYSALLSALTLTQTFTCTSGSPILTNLSDTSQLPQGASSILESTCMPAGSFIIGKTSTTVTMNNNASLSTSTSGVFFPYGNGNGSTTFNVPDLRGWYVAGRCNMGGTSCSTLTTGNFNGNPNATGGIGGASAINLVTANMPPYTPTGTVIAAGTVSAPTITTTTTLSGAATNAVNGSTGVSANLTGGGGALQQATITAGSVSSSSTPVFNNSGSAFIGNAQGGSSTPIFPLPPTRTLNYIIKILPDVNLSTANAVTMLGGMVGDIACGPGVICTDNVISSTLGLIVQPSVVLTTTGVLPNTPIYANGAAGVGATLTASSNGALSIDSVLTVVTQRVLVKNQALAFQNGCYTVTTVGSGGTPYVLTRCTDFDTPAEMLSGSYFLTTAGTVNTNASFVLSQTVTTVGTTAANFYQFSSLNTEGFAVTKSVSGAASGRLLINSVTIPSDNVNVTVNCSGNFVPPCNPSGEGWRYVAPINIDYQIGGPNVQGSRVGLMSNMAVVAANNPADTSGGYYNAIFSSAAATTDSNGSPGDPRGYVYALALQSIAQSGATHWGWVTGQQTDVAVHAGATVFGKVGLIINQMAQDRVQGSNVDAALVFSTQTGAPGWSCLICTEGFAGSSQVISPSGTFIHVNTPQTFNKFMDITLATVTKVFDLTAAQKTIAQNDLGFGVWTAYTPTLSCGSGTLTSATAVGAYMLINKTLFVRADATITTNGTCAGSLNFSAPLGLTSKASQILAGRTGSAGRMVQAIYSTGSATFLTLDYVNAYPGASGQDVFFNGAVEIN